MSADNTQETSQTTDSNQKQSNGNADGLSALQEQLKAINEKLEATQQAVIESRKPLTPQAAPRERNLYDPSDLLDAATEMSQKMIKAENEKNMMIYTLAQDYPEIQTNAEIRKAVIDAQRTLPQALQDTAAGYEVAVLKAVSRAGLIPKSKRQTVDADVSLGSSNSSRPREERRVKVSEKTLQLAELMGRDTSDPKVLKGLEDAANRSYGRWKK